MACSTCDGYEFVPDPAGTTGRKVDCPDCRAPRKAGSAAGILYCPVHGSACKDGRCPQCGREAGRALVLLDDARTAAEAAVCA